MKSSPKFKNRSIILRWQNLWQHSTNSSKRQGQKLKIVILLAIIVLAAVLRLYKLSVNPPGLYWDEAVLGYDAYSILKTGKDHHGDFLPLFFESFGDWKLPGYHYLLVPSIAIFGLSEFAVRFPSALLGLLTVFTLFLIVKKLTQNTNLALFSALFLAISPWHIQFSRGGFEATAGLFFFVLGTYFFLFLIDRKTKPNSAFFLSAIAFATAGLFALSMYTYHAYRIFTPLFTVAIVLIYFGKIKKNYQKLILPSVFSIIAIIPLLIFTFTSQGRSRAISQSAFNIDKFEEARVNFDQKSKKPLRFLSKYWQPSIYYSYLIIDSYLDHFSPVFLFYRGDQVGRHSQVDMGQIYLFEGILLVVSFFAFKEFDRQAIKVLLAWLILAPIPATIVLQTPHALRTLQMAPVLSFFSAVGLGYILRKKGIFIFKFLLILVIFYSFLTYLHLLFVHYPQKFSADWQDGYREMVKQIEKYQERFDKVYVTNINQVPYIYLLFYQKYDPQKFISQKGTRDAFDKYVFIPDDVEIPDGERLLYVAPSWKKVDGIWLAAANDSQGRHIYSLWEVNGPFK